MIDELLMREFIADDRQGCFDVTNLLALLGARNLRDFPSVRDKAPRLVEYQKTDKLTGKDETTGQLGYAISLMRLVRHIMTIAPKHEEMRHGIRVTEHAYPEVALRELIANAMIHQDFTISGYPYIEMFSDRIKISSPGRPLIPVDRFIDAPPRSRNNQLAKAMRDLRLCEERGSGVDRAIDAIEEQALPPPLFSEIEEFTTVVLSRDKSFARMSKQDRIRACYQHACLRNEAGDPMSNGSLRRRFGLGEKQYPQVSEVIRDAIEAGLIKPLDSDQPNRKARYVPVRSG
jgi:predicted HTH transcriptional regulator